MSRRSDPLLARASYLHHRAGRLLNRTRRRALPAGDVSPNRLGPKADPGPGRDDTEATHDCSRAGHAEAAGTLFSGQTGPMRSYKPLSTVALEWATRQIGPNVEVLARERLTGGITSDVDRLVVRQDRREQILVLKRWAVSEESPVVREAEALQAAESHSLPAPRLIAVDPTGAEAGIRCLLMTAVPGEVELAPPDLSAWLQDLAAAQHRIHAVPPVLSTRHDGLMNPKTPARWLTDPGLRREALAAARTSGGEVGFVHGDYQHFNVLWVGGRLRGVVDWSMGGVGPLGTDVGHCRLNLAVLFSADTADEYLRRYAALAGPVDPRADLRGLLSFGRDWERFIPLQVGGRAAIDLVGMSGRVVETVRRAVDRLG